MRAHTEREKNAPGEKKKSNPRDEARKKKKKSKRVKLDSTKRCYNTADDTAPRSVAVCL